MQPLVRSTVNWIHRHFSAQRVVVGTRIPETLSETRASRVTETSPLLSIPDIEVVRRLMTDLHTQRVAVSQAVATPHGMAKLVTVTEVIEIAPVFHWQDALAQVEGLQQHFPNLQSRLHLYGKIRPAWLRCIRAKCASRGVYVTYDRHFGR